MNTKQAETAFLGLVILLIFTALGYLAGYATRTPTPTLEYEEMQDDE